MRLLEGSPRFRDLAWEFGVEGYWVNRDWGLSAFGIRQEGLRVLEIREMLASGISVQDLLWLGLQN